MIRQLTEGMTQMKNKLTKIIRYDCICGFRYNLKTFIIAVMFVILNCAMFKVFSSWAIETGLDYECTFMDYLIYFFKGVAAIDLNNGSFDIPVIFLGLQIIIACMVGYYPFDDIYGYGKQVFIRVDKKSRWWLSKCFWVLMTVLCTYVLIYAAIFIFCLCSKDSISLSYSSELVWNMDNQFIGLISKGNIMLYTFVMPVMYSLMISFVQVTFSMLTGPVISFLIVMIYDILGILLTHSTLLANYTMILRDEMVSGAAIQPMVGIVIMTVIMLVSIILGVFVINRKEIFEK